jgi:Na+/proline symporter
METQGLHAADYAVLGAYLVGITFIGIWAARKIKSSDDFFMPRKFGKVFMIMFSFGAGTHSDQAVSVASKSFTNGLSGIWYQWLWLPVTPFYWLIAPIFRRFRAITTADVFEKRFGPSVSMLYATVGMFSLMVVIGMMLKGSGEVISSATGGMIKTNTVIALMTVMFVIYGVAGGLAAAIVTDFVQGVLTIVFSFLLLPLILNAIGGFEGLRAGISDPEKLTLVAPAEIGVFYIAVIAFNALVGIVTQPHTMGNCAAGKTEMEGRVGFMVGTFLKRLCTIPWCLTGVAGIVYFAGKHIEPDRVFGAVAGDFLPQIFHGALGLFIAALLASVMSSCDAFMISSSALFTENVYRRLEPGKSQKHYITVGRIASIIVVAGGVGFAYWVPNVIAALEIFWKITPMMAIAFWLGLFWRRTTVAGAWASTIAALATWWLVTREFFVSMMANCPCTEALRFIMEKPTGAEIYLPWQMVFYLAAGTIVGIIVSVFTKPVGHEKLESFYALIRTPIQPGEVVTKACTLPADAVVPAKRNMFPNTNLEIPVPTRTSVLGFIAGWACAAAIVYAVYIIANM